MSAGAGQPGAGTNCVFVGNLAWGTTEESLRAFAARVGPVLSAQIQTHNDTGRSKGWGLVHYTSPDAAQQAINVLNGAELDGRKLHVREDRTYIDSAEGVVIFVGNLPWSVTSETLAQLFSEYNPIDVHVKTNMAGRSRVKVASVEVGNLAINALNGYEIEGRAIQVRFDRQQSEDAGYAAAGGAAGYSERIAVGNLAWGTDNDELKTFLSTAGTVTNVEVQRHSDTGRSKGWAIVTFRTGEEAQHAINTLNKAVLRDRPLSLKPYTTSARR